MPTQPSRLRIRATLATLAAIAALLVHPRPALAGTYTVHACQTPSGIFTGPAGWTSAGSPAMAGYDVGSSTVCASGPAALQFGASGLPVRVGAWLSWDFTVPDNTMISSYDIARAFNLGWPVIRGTANRAYLLQIWHDDDQSRGLLDFEAPLQGDQTLTQEFPSDVSGDRTAWRALHVSLSCWGVVGSLDCGPFPAQVLISRASVGLTDDSPPGGFAIGGTMMDSGPVRGTGDLALHAYDGGGGVYRFALAVDGNEVSRQVLDSGGGTCADVDPGNDDAHEFGAPQPCPLDEQGDVQLDTTPLRDGDHRVRASVEDAAGNETVIYDGTIETHNAPINGSAPTLGGDARVGQQLAAAPGQWDGSPTGYDHRWLRCDADGANCAPVAGATGSQYTLTDADAYHRMRVEVTAANGSGSSTAQSSPSALVADAGGHSAPQPPPAGQGGGGSTPSPAPSPGGIQGIENPLASQPGHVANGADATARARLTAAFERAGGGTVKRVLLAPGRRATIVGRLVDAAGAGIGGARLGAALRITGRGWVARPGVRTQPDGRFVYVLPSGPSRDVRFTYFPYSDSHAPELSNVVRADALAPLAIRADPRRVTGTRVVRISGRVGGVSIPRGGLLVTLEGWQRGWGWRAFRTVRTNRSGRWSTRYRFRLSSGRFGFRALVPHQGSFPYATSRSGGVYVVVS